MLMFSFKHDLSKVSINLLSHPKRIKIALGLDSVPTVEKHRQRAAPAGHFFLWMSDASANGQSDAGTRQKHGANKRSSQTLNLLNTSCVRERSKVRNSKIQKRCENKDWIYVKKCKNNLKNRLKWKNTKTTNKWKSKKKHKKMEPSPWMGPHPGTGFQFFWFTFVFYVSFWVCFWYVLLNLLFLLLNVSANIGRYGIVTFHKSSLAESTPRTQQQKNWPVTTVKKTPLFVFVLM